MANGWRNRQKNGIKNRDFIEKFRKKRWRNTRVYKEKQYLIFDFEDGRTVKYDFATKTAIGIKGKPVGKLCGQLRGLSIENLLKCCDDQKYAKFLAFVQKQEPYPIENIGTILDRVPRYANYEQLFSAGIDDILCSGCSFKYKINDIPKALIKLCKTHAIQLSNSILEYYKKNPNAIILGYHLEYMSLDDRDIYKLWTRDESEYNRETLSYDYYTYFDLLINYFGYTAKALFLYADQLKTYEAMEDMGYLIKELYDYAKMMNTISDKFDKYPRHFLTTHKIACRNYNRMKKEFSEDLFKKRIMKKYECTFGDYQFIYPENIQDIKDESVQQNNCVSSYIDKVIDGKCHIMFLRKKSAPDESLVTIEIRNDRIVQAKRRFNDDVTDEEQKVIDNWNKKFSNKKEEVTAWLRKIKLD